MLSAAIICAALSLTAEVDERPFSDATPIDDLALIYTGGQQRPDWNKDLFKPYVVHTYHDGKMSWMFDGFLMIEFAMYNDDGQYVGLGENVWTGQNAAYKGKQEDWSRLLDVQLGTKTGNGVRALDDLIGEYIPVIGAPGHKHKVVLTMPINGTKGAELWGEIDGKNISMNQREMAMKWYADEIERRWNAAGFKNVELDGIYWVKEAFSNSLTSDEENLVAEISRYCKTKGWAIYWIPYRNASGIDKAKTKFKIDLAYQQPNYYFQEYRTDASGKQYPVTKQWLYSAIVNAWDRDMGLEIEFEGYNFTWNPTTKVRRKVTPVNIGLFGLNQTYYYRFKDYLDAFESYTVSASDEITYLPNSGNIVGEKFNSFDWLPMAYYSGYQGVYDFETSGNAMDRQIINRLAIIMNKRHQITKWDSAPRTPASGITEVAVGNNEIAFGGTGCIVIDEKAEDVSVYTIDGRLVYSDNNGGSTDYGMGRKIDCNPGIYVVRSGRSAVRVAVR